MPEPTSDQARTTRQLTLSRERAQNRFLREATPALLAQNQREWTAYLRPLLDRQLAPSFTAQRIRRAREIVHEFKLRHTLPVAAMPEIARRGQLDCNATLVSLLGPKFRSETYDIDREKGLDRFVFFTLGQHRFGQHRGFDMVSLVAKPAVMEQPDAFGAFEDWVFAWEAQKFGRVADGWAMYLQENFRGADFSEVAALLIAASYADPDDYLQWKKPSYRPRLPGVEFGRSMPQFEVKVFDHLPLTELSGIECNLTNETVKRTLLEAGFREDQLIHDPDLL